MKDRSSNRTWCAWITATTSTDLTPPGGRRRTGGAVPGRALALRGPRHPYGNQTIVF